eukprot:4864066-Amphidinium_carterae.1
MVVLLETHAPTSMCARKTNVPSVAQVLMKGRPAASSALTSDSWKTGGEYLIMVDVTPKWKTYEFDTSKFPVSHSLASSSHMCTWVRRGV